jgi:diketogulonate reductase-like aldo/keto reductase
MNSENRERIEMMNDYLILSNGIKMPIVGFGTWQLKAGEETVLAVQAAIKAGYRHIDTAMIYGNEISVGQAIRESGIKRQEIFLTTKLWNDDQGYESTLKAFEKSLERLQMSYVDLYLIHWPSVHQFPDYIQKNRDTWRAMEELYSAGKIKAIGVSNFMPEHFEALLETAKIVPMVNQILVNPGNQNREAVDYCQKKKVIVQAYTPLMKGEIFKMPLLQELSLQYQKSIPQIVLRWLLQKGIVSLTKSATLERIQANIDIFNFVLEDDDIKRIDGLDQSK